MDSGISLSFDPPEEVPREARWSYGAAVGASSVSMSTPRCLLRCSTSSSWVALQQLPCRSWRLPCGATCCGILSCWTSESRGDIGSYATIGHQERNTSSWKLSVFFSKDVSLKEFAPWYTQRGCWKDSERICFLAWGVLKMTVARVALKKRQDMQKWPCCILACQLLRAIWYKRTLQQWTRAFRNQQKAITDMFTIHRQCGSGVYYCYRNLFAGNQTDRGSCILRISTNAPNLFVNPLNNKLQILRCKKKTATHEVCKSLGTFIISQFPGCCLALSSCGDCGNGAKPQCRRGAEEGLGTGWLSLDLKQFGEKAETLSTWQAFSCMF